MFDDGFEKREGEFLRKSWSFTINQFIVKQFSEFQSNHLGQINRHSGLSFANNVKGKHFQILFLLPRDGIIYSYSKRLFYS
jgi:penicillin-binding protein-related factor A (putative recombinase)